MQTKQYSNNWIIFMNTINKVFTIFVLVWWTMPKNKCLFPAKLLDDPCYSEWLRKTSDELALCSYCKSCYVFNILYRYFYFFMCRYCTSLLKAVSLNPLGACFAEKQQSDEKLSKSENKQSLIMRWQPRFVRSSVTTHRGNFNFHLFQFWFFQCLTWKALMSSFDCLYLYYISGHAFHFLTLLVFKLFCFGNM